MLEVPAQAPVDLVEYLRILRRRAWVVAVVTALTVGAAYAWASTRDRVYTATGEIVVAQTTANGQVATQNEVVQSDAVHRQALRSVPNAPWVSATFDGESGTVQLRATSSDPALAAKAIDAQIQAYKNYLTFEAIARAAAVNTRIRTLQEQIAQLDQPASGRSSSSASNQLTGLRSEVQSLRARLPDLEVAIALAGPNVEVLRGGAAPTSASTINTRHAMLIGLGIGLLLGVLAALLLELLDDSIRTREHLVRIAGADVPVLGTIPPARTSAPGMVVLEQPMSPAAEAYRSLRTAVQFVRAERARHNGHAFRCIAVTSARTRQGKTETATNLAILNAQMGQRTVLVDCDMRAPRVHELLGVANDVGFASVVCGQGEQDAVQRVEGIERLLVLPSGPEPPNPTELLVSHRSHEVLAGLSAKKKNNTLVIVDTPPVLLATDALALGPALGGILLVVTARTTRKKELQSALEQLRLVEAPLLGMVLHAAATRFGRPRGWRERRRARRRRESNGLRAVEPEHTTPEAAEIVTEPARAVPASDETVDERTATVAEAAEPVDAPVRAVAWSAPPDGAGPDTT
jgi:capsular exopolysaccharide synthesis family protein